MAGNDSKDAQSMAISSDDLIRQKLIEVQQNYFATNQTSIQELKALRGPFVDLIAEAIKNNLPDAVNASLQHAADDFRSMLYAMMICGGLEINREDAMFSALTARGLMHTFFFDARALFDYMLRATLVLYDIEIRQAGGVFTTGWLERQLRETSYSRFLRVCTDNAPLARGVFGDELLNLWLGCDWYRQFTDVRNGLTHGGLFLKVDSTNLDAFVIETLDRQYPLHGLVPAKLIEQDNSVSFSLFSGMLAGFTIDLFSKWSVQLQKKANLTALRSAYGGRGASMCAENIERVIEKLRN